MPGVWTIVYADGQDLGSRRFFMQFQHSARFKGQMSRRGWFEARHPLPATVACNKPSLCDDIALEVFRPGMASWLGMKII